MKKKKQEAIKEAWGETAYVGLDMDMKSHESHWYEHFKKTGSVYYNLLNAHNKLFIDRRDDILNLQGWYYPKSLKGIENNNGWIIINNTEDLPKEECWVRVFCISNVPDHPICYIALKSKVIKEMLPYITHYQTIVKPLPPIY